MRTLLLLSFPFLSFAGFSYAQQPGGIARVETAPNFHAAIEAQFQAYEQGLTTHCDTVSADWQHATHKVYGQPESGLDGNLVNATWVEAVPGSACEQTRRYRALVVIRGGKASIGGLLPGDGFASPQLEQDAEKPLAEATAGFVPKGQTCAVDILDTHLAGAAPTHSKQPWNEVWKVQSCGKRLSIPIQFVPDAVGEGTSIHMESRAISLLS